MAPSVLTNELRLEEAYRWACLCIPDGTAEIQRRTIARRLLERRYRKFKSVYKGDKRMQRRTILSALL